MTRKEKQRKGNVHLEDDDVALLTGRDSDLLGELVDGLELGVDLLMSAKGNVEPGRRRAKRGELDFGVLLTRARKEVLHEDKGQRRKREKAGLAIVAMSV
jgi:hypothetical protein